MGIKTVTVGADVEVEEKNLLESALDVVLMSTKSFSPNTDTYIRESDAGLACLGHLVGGVFIGEVWGHNRAADGKDAFLRFMQK